MMTIGADPEVFVGTLGTSKPVPVCGKLGGTKMSPKRMRSEWPEGFTYQEDNVAAEFNIPPCTSGSQFSNSIVYGLEGVANELLKSGLALVWPDSSSANNMCEHMFPYEELSDPRAQQFGCAPDFDAYNKGNPWPLLDRKVLMNEDKSGEWRFTGGHVHFGYMNDIQKIPPFVVAGFMDIALGLWSVPRDPQKKRRALYGQAGRYRPTSYGIEYRTLSNFWVFSTSLCSVVFQNTYNVFKYLQKTPLSVVQGHYQSIPWLDVQRAINESDAKLAVDLQSFITKELGVVMQ